MRLPIIERFGIICDERQCTATPGSDPRRWEATGQCIEMRVGRGHLSACSLRRSRFESSILCRGKFMRLSWQIIGPFSPSIRRVFQRVLCAVLSQHLFCMFDDCVLLFHSVPSVPAYQISTSKSRENEHEGRTSFGRDENSAISSQALANRRGRRFGGDR